MNKSLQRIILILLGCWLINTSYAASGDRDFRAGITAFKTGNYSQAIADFERARNKGKHSSDLYYNLGVSYYHNGQYERSEQAFTHLLRDPKFRQLASYNLGLVALAKQQKQNALRWFRRAANMHDDNKVTALANRMITANTMHSSQPRISGMLSLGYGHDSNVTLASTGSPTQKSDNYSELFGFISIPTGKLLINASIFDQRYSTVHAADFTQLSAGALYPLKRGRWLLLPGIYLNRDYLNSASFISLANLQFSASKPMFTQGRLQLRYRYSYISADNPTYNYLQGNRQQFTVQASNPTPWGQLRLRYQLELNNRQNLANANYSPTRHSLNARLKQKHEHGWQTSETLSWRNSQYGTAGTVTRKDTLYKVKLNASTRLSGNWHGGFRYTYSDNQSNLSNESYTRNDIMAYLNWFF